MTIGSFSLTSPQYPRVDYRQFTISKWQEHLRRIMRKDFPITDPLSHQRLMGLFADVIGVSDWDRPAQKAEEFAAAIPGVDLDEPRKEAEVPLQQPTGL